MSSTKGADRANPSRTTTFSSLRNRDFRLYMAGSVSSSTGSWVLRIAQDWLVLSLTGSPAAVGLTIALQSLPTLLLTVPGGALADRYPMRRIVQLSYAGFAVLAALLAALTLTQVVQAWHLQLIALGTGITAALSTPARQVFVHELVGSTQLRNAVSLNSAALQLAGLIGPALSGVLMGVAGVGWSFAITAASYVVPILALTRMRSEQVRTRPPQRARLRTGLRYAAQRPDILWPTLLVSLFGLFTANLPVVLAPYAKDVFHSGASGYGLFNTVVAAGALLGALVSARLGRTRLRTLMAFAAALSLLYIAAAAATTQLVFCGILLSVGAATMLVNASANSTVQLASPPTMRGRVMALYVLTYYTATTAGAPIAGTLIEHLGPRPYLLLAGGAQATICLLITARLAIARSWAHPMT
ncbi:MFS transporter [Kribbella sp. HUAS MG21]|uniref:MFS transporter n=1 Tax=Kribbella sp. HUAS MG21 TaxID=3160966 RepID=A0AAU7TMH6_9ACTN